MAFFFSGLGTDLAGIECHVTAGTSFLLSSTPFSDLRKCDMG